jgi:hypothetical protein
MKLNKTWQAVIAVVINVIIFVAFWRNYVWLSFAFFEREVFYDFLVIYVLLFVGVLINGLIRRRVRGELDMFSSLFLISSVVLILVSLDIYITKLVNWELLLSIMGVWRYLK